jgi:hypothetical protein
VVSSDLALPPFAADPAVWPNDHARRPDMILKNDVVKAYTARTRN